MSAMIKKKVIVSQVRIMELNDEDIAYLREVIKDGDGQAFHEFTEIDYEGDMKLEVLDES